MSPTSRYQVYRCGHQNCGLFFVQAAEPYPALPYCPLRDEREPETAHPVEHAMTVEACVIDERQYLLPSHVRYTHVDRDGAVCCDFIAEGCAEVRCPNCGEALPDAEQQMLDPERQIWREVA